MSLQEPTPAPRAWPVGKRYDGGRHVADPAHALAYAEATADPAAAYTGADAICPPMFHVRLMHGLIWQIATDPELGLDMLRLVHGEHDATFHKPIRPGQTVEVRGTLVQVDEKPSGLVVTSRLEGWVDGTLAVSCRTVYFVRAAPDAARPAESPRPPRAPEPAPTPDWTAEVALSDDQSLRYAAASLDDNPIHTDPATAAAAGLPGIIVQGLCTLAVSAAAAVRAAAGGDPRRVRRIAARFARPVRNGETLTLHGRATAEGCGFTTLNAAGQPVLAQGVVEIA